MIRGKLAGFPLSFLPLLLAEPRAQTPVLDTLILNGPTGNRINVLFLGDGFTQGELARFLAGARAAAESVFSSARNPTRFYVDYAAGFNAFALRTASKESGVSRPDEGIKRDTFYKCAFGGEWNLGDCDDAKATATVKQYLPEYDVLIMIFNKAAEQRATGGPVIYVPEGESIATLKHEMGHNLGLLWDEYIEDGWTGTCHEYVNTTAETQRDRIKWRSWIEPATAIPTPASVANRIGLFEGADYLAKGCYRPKSDCLMKGYSGASSGRLVQFCEVCLEQMILQLYRKIDPVDSAEPEAETVALRADEDREFRVGAVFRGANITFTWLLDGKALASASGPKLLLGGLPAGPHTLRALVRDTTAAVRRSLPLLADTVDWKITVTPGTAARPGREAVRGLAWSGAHLDLVLAEESRVSVAWLDANGRRLASASRVLPAGSSSLPLPRRPGAVCRLEVAPLAGGPGWKRTLRTGLL